MYFLYKRGKFTTYSGKSRHLEEILFVELEMLQAWVALGLAPAVPWWVLSCRPGSGVEKLVAHLFGTVIQMRIDPEPQRNEIYP